MGVVEERGSGVDNLELGDRVFVVTGKTRWASGSPVGDAAGNYTGVGGHEASVVVLIPDEVSNVQASMGGVTVTSVVGRNLTNPQSGELVLVLGQGMIGQMAAQLYRGKGARVITADILETRVAISKKISADIAINSSHEDVVDVVHREQSAGADIVVECTGCSETMPMMLRAIRGDCNDSEKSGKYPCRDILSTLFKLISTLPIFVVLRCHFFAGLMCRVHVKVLADGKRPLKRYRP